MKFRVNRTLPVSIKEQLKRQIRGMIHSGILDPGDSLPSCKDMSAILSVNRNTVASVYAELSSEGVLTSNRGAGTTVSQVSPPADAAPLKNIMDETFIRAQTLGFSNEEITDQFFTALAAQASSTQKTILMVWCNPITVDEVGEALAAELGVHIKSLLVDEVVARPEKAEACLAESDLVVTSLNYIDVILPLAEKQGVEVTGIILTPVGRVLNEIVKLDAGTTVGFACVNNLAAESSCKGVHLSGQISLKTIWAGADDAERFKKMIADCDVIFATHHVYDQAVAAANGSDKQVIRLDVSITNTNIQLIRERLESHHV